MTRDQPIDPFTRIVNDPEARRELLWIQAMGKGDLEHARHLLEMDRDIEDRLRALHHDIEPPADATWRERADHFLLLWCRHRDLLEARFASPA